MRYCLFGNPCRVTVDVMKAAEALAQNGYYYCATFAAPSEGAQAAAELAAELGTLCHGTARTAPSPAARTNQPFDRAEALGWHSDFTTHAERPRFSLSFVERQDPRGSPWGDWRVARVPDVLSVIRASPGGHEVFRILHESHPFEFDGSVFRFPVLTREGDLRFYGDGLRRGLALEPLGREYLSAVTAVENAADQCAVDLVASAGALLVVDNRMTLHYRRQQTVVGAELRRAHLVFAG
jgi:hypothetical protein